MPSFKIIGQEDFNHIWAWRPPRSCDLDNLHVYTNVHVNFCSTSKEAPHEIRALISQAVLKLLIMNTKTTTDGRLSMGIAVDHSSGELKKISGTRSPIRSKLGH